MDSINDESRDLCLIRRELTLDEQAKREKYLAQSEPLCGMSGKERKMLYILARSTDLKEDELASLTWESFNPSDSTPSLTTSASHSSSGSDNVHQLPVEVAKRFEEWQEEISAAPNDKVFPNFDVTRAKEMWRKDLYNAGIKL